MLENSKGHLLPFDLCMVLPVFFGTSLRSLTLPRIDLGINVFGLSGCNKAFKDLNQAFMGINKDLIQDVSKASQRTRIVDKKSCPR